MPTIPAELIVTPVVEAIVNGSAAAAGSNAKRDGNNFYYRCSNVVGVVSKAAFYTIFNTTVVAVMIAAKNARYSVNNVDVRRLDLPGDAFLRTANAGVGAIATDSEPTVDAVVVKLVSLMRGKVGRGFKHFGSTSEVDTTGDVLTGAGLARWQTVRDALKVVLVDANGNSWTPIIASRYLAVWDFVPPTIRGSDVTNSVLNLTVSTMRRRKAKTTT